LNGIAPFSLVDPDRVVVARIVVDTRWLECVGARATGAALRRSLEADLREAFADVARGAPRSGRRARIPATLVARITEVTLGSNAGEGGAADGIVFDAALYAPDGAILAWRPITARNAAGGFWAAPDNMLDRIAGLSRVAAGWARRELGF
jgi:hypothetical protein